MIQKKLFKTVSCVLTCFLISCNGSTNGKKEDLSARDSIVKAPIDSGFVAQNPESVKTDSCIKVVDERFSSLSEVSKRVSKRASYFVIKTNRDTVIKCNEGTLLSIPANAFLNASNQSPVVGEVKISVKEFYKISDMMMQGLTTTSNKQLLETGGMIHIKATSKETNDSCILRPGKNVVIALANSDTSDVDRMQLFNGVHGGTTVSWVPAAGLAASAQSWKPGMDNFSQTLFPLTEGFVFPDKVLKIKPQVIKSKPENLQVEIKISLRDLMQYVGVVTKKANAYIDTSGNLHCYKIDNKRQYVSFTEIYSPTTYQSMKVNLAVDVKLSFKSNLNHDYYQKLFKMGKGSPDSLVTLTATLNPNIKMTDFSKIKTIYDEAVTVKEYQKKQKRRALLIQEYEKKLQQLRLEDENRLSKSEKNGTINLQSAQNYLLLSTAELGWINCDRFYSYPTKVDYFVTLKERASLLIVFKAMKSIMAPEKDGSFQNVPLNEKITIVGLKTENGKLMMAFHETTITEKPFEALSFKPVTVKEYKARLEKLNRL